MQLFFDNLATLLSLIAFMTLVFTGFYNDTLMKNINASEYTAEMALVFQTINELIFAKSIPGLGITMVFGNIYYTYMGARLGRMEDRKGKVTALPYGINTPGAFAFVFGILGPATLAYSSKAQCNLIPTGEDGLVANQQEAELFAKCWADAATAGWSAGVVSNFLAGIISVALSFFGKYILNLTPAVALLTGLAGIGFAFLGIAQVAQNFAEPIAGYVPLFLVIMLYFGEVRTGWMPKSAIVALAGVVLGWADGVATPEALQEAALQVKPWGVSTGFDALGDWSNVGDYIGTVFPVALAAAAGTLMNVLSAQQAGENYGVTETMIADGVGTMIGAIFGTPFGTSVYIGFPAYKKMEAGIIYSLLNCVLYFFFAVFGVFALIQALVPFVAVSPLIFFVGLMICQEAMAAAPVRQYPAFIFGLIPSTLDWAVTSGVNYGSVGNTSFYGMAALQPGAILLSMIITALCVHIIDRNYTHAVVWSLAAAFLSAFGLLHQDTATVKDWTEPQMQYCAYSDSWPAEKTGTAPEFTCPTGYSYCSPSYGTVSCATQKTVKWRFMTAYLMLAVLFAGFFGLQRFGFVDPKIEDDAEDELDTRKSAVKQTMRKDTVGDLDTPKPDIQDIPVPNDTQKVGAAVVGHESVHSESVHSSGTNNSIENI